MTLIGFSLISDLLAALSGFVSSLISSPQWDMAYHFLPHVLVSLALGALLGLERRNKHKVAGVRTHMVVSASACLIALCGAYTAQVTGVGDPTRLAAQILAGIGFVGAGVILRQGFRTSGVTTASTILFSAGIGIACGLGYFGIATLATVLLLVSLVVTYRIFPSNETGGHLLKIICPLDKFDEVKKLFGTNNRVDSLQKLGDKIEFRLHTELTSKQLDVLLAELVKNPDVYSVDVIDDPQ